MRKFLALILILALTFNITAVSVQSGTDTVSSSAGLCAYYDDNGIIRLISFSIDDIPKGLSCTIGENRFDIACDKLVSGCVFEYLRDENNVVSGDSLSVKLSCDGGEKTLTMPAVKIVPGSPDDWETSPNGHVILRYHGKDSLVTIPNFIGGKPIVSVGAGSGGGNLLKGSESTISGAVFSNGITSVNYAAFANVTTLESLVLPDTLAEIDAGAFFNTGLSHTLHFPASLREIGDQAFRKTGLTGVEFSNGLERIGQLAFYQCNDLAGGLKLPDTLEIIDMGAFAYCEKLSGELKLPASLTTLGDSCFHSCKGFTGDLVIPSGVKTVPRLAFCCCTGFDGKLIISEGVEEIGYVAFGGSGSADAPRFTAVEFPSTLKHIGLYCFQFCGAVKHLELNEGLEFISDGAFDHMTGLDNTSLVIPSTVRTIGGDNVKDGEENTGCGDHVFYDMGKDEYFTAFEVAAGNPYFSTRDGVLYDHDKTRMVAYPRGKSDSRFVLPDTVTQIDLMAFSRPVNLKTLVLPDNFIVSDEVPANSLNTDGSNLAVALYAYNNLEAIEVNPTNPNYTAVNGVLYSKDMKAVWYIPQAAQGDVVIASGCERLEKGAVYLADKNRIKWNRLLLPESIEYVDSDVETMLKAKAADKVSYYKKGDLNFSGVVENEDIKELLLKAASGDISVFETYSCDMNNDGKVDLLDAILIMQKTESGQ